MSLSGRPAAPGADWTARYYSMSMLRRRSALLLLHPLLEIRLADLVAAGVVANEFGERSFAFVAPDGYTFALIE